MSIQDAYDVCEQITRHEARNFSYGIRLLPPAKRRAMSAIYAMARRIDDIGDGTLPPAIKAEQLTAVRAQLHALDDPHPDPVLTALADAARRLPIPVEAFDDLIDGCEADVAGDSYATVEDTVRYCRQVAGSVGRLSVGVYDPPDPDRARPLADALGVALQLTNILRDLCEDRRVGRIYLPQEDLDRFGCTLFLGLDGNLADPVDAFRALVRFEAARAEQWYAEGLALLPMLDRRSAACTAAMAGIYHRLLARIVDDPDPVRSTRMSLSGRTKAAVAARALLSGTA